MRRFLTGLSIAAAVALFGSAAQAECFQGHVTATAPSEPDVVAMSTPESAPPVVTEEAAETAVASDCPDGATECEPADQQ